METGNLTAEKREKESEWGRQRWRIKLSISSHFDVSRPKISNQRRAVNEF